MSKRNGYFDSKRWWLTYLACLLTSLLFAGCTSTPPSSSSTNRGFGSSERGIKITKKIQRLDPRKRVALLIGNGAYKTARLRNPVNDVDDMAKKLQQLGFDVVKLTDATRKEMREALRNFGARLERGGVALFYYAGHGLQLNGENYLVPIGADIKKEHEAQDECLRVGAVLAEMENRNSSLNMIFLDACRDNPFRGFSRSTNRGLASMDAPSGSLIAYATAPGKEAADGDGRNGVYTQYLLKHLPAKNLDVALMLRAVRVDVEKATGGEQTPWESTSIKGSFCFNPDDYGSEDDLRHKREELASYQKIISAKEQERREREAALLEKQIAEAKKRLEESKAQETKTTQAEPKAERAERERKQREAEQSIAKLSSDGRYEVSSEGVITDTKTNLQWYVGPDQDTTWDQADAWVKKLTVAGGGWRLPTLDELEGIYETNKEYNLDKVFGSRNIYIFVWSNKTKGSSSAWCFPFDNGLRDWGNRSASNLYRGFAVRSGSR